MAVTVTRPIAPGAADLGTRAGKRRARRTTGPRLIVVVLALCGIVVSLQQTLVIPLLPDLPRLLHTTSDSASWLVTATLLSGAIATPTVSRLADMYGKRRMMGFVLAASAAGSLLGALSDALPLLIAARAMQGFGMALIPVGIAMMRDELPRAQVPLGVALLSGTMALGAGVGLPLSGVIVERSDWHAIFWLTGGVSAGLLVIALLILPESPVRPRGTFDFLGALLLSVALSALLLALSKGAQWGWTSPETLGLAAVGAVVLGIWTPLELRTLNPLVDLRVAARRAVLLVNVLSVLIGFAMFANMLVTTELLQAPEASGYGLGLNTLHAGLWMVPNAAAFGLMAPVSAWMSRRYNPQVTILSGCMMMGLAYVGRVPFSTTLTEIVVGSVMVGTGTALTYGAIPTLVMRAVPRTETASANGLNVLLRSVGTSTASATTAAISSVWVIDMAGGTLPSFDAMVMMFWLAAAASFGAALLCLPTLRMTEYDDEADGLESRDPEDGSRAREPITTYEGCR